MSAQTLQQLRSGELAGARSLRIACGLTEFPREILALADTLELLDLSGNALQALPDDLDRLHRLRVIFCSHNRFETLPPVLGACTSLGQIGFRATGLRRVPPESLPPRLRWLTLTDNRIERLPDMLGDCTSLQKLMLSGNRLDRLPERMAGLPALELLRLSANRFEALPPWLHRLDRLAWLGWAGNPLDRDRLPSQAPVIEWSRLEPGELLGEGASGRVHRALWHPAAAAPRPVALKLFKSGMTSDGLPEREIAASLEAGAHPGLPGALGRLAGHPDGTDGLVMPLLPPGWKALAGPPSLRSCSRDVWDDTLRLEPGPLLRIVTEVGRAAATLHERGLLHGDLYAHNVIWDGTEGAAVLSDFGAASYLPPGNDREWLTRIEVRAWGLLLGELLACRAAPVPPQIAAIHQACIQPGPMTRPSLREALDRLGALE